MMRKLLLAMLISAAVCAPAFAGGPHSRSHGSLPHRAVKHTRHAAHHVRAHLHHRARQVRHAVRHL